MNGSNTGSSLSVEIYMRFSSPLLTDLSILMVLWRKSTLFHFKANASPLRIPEYANNLKNT